jgi:Fe-S cluster assembly protein SufD
LAEVALKSIEEKLSLSSGLVEEISQVRRELSAAHSWRQRASQIYQETEMPDRVRHLWRYTDPNLFSLGNFSLPAKPGSLNQFDGLPPDEPAILLAGPVPEVNAAAAATVSLGTLGQNPEDMNFLGTLIGPQHGLFEALNGAAWTTGLVVRLKRGQVLSKPLRLVIPAGEVVHLPRVLILAEEGAEATIIEDHNQGNGKGRVVAVSEVFMGPGARVRHVLLQRWSAGVHGHLTFRARLGPDSHLFSVFASLGGAVSKLDLGAELAGSGAESQIVGVALGEGRQHFDHHTEHRHLRGHTLSNLDFKVALAGRSRSAYTGLIRIEEGAPHSEAYQENRNLLLSKKCRADTIPELEILTDEVQCTHGATASPVDPEQVFYIRSRGPDFQETLRLIVRGFLEGTLSRIPSTLRPEIEQLVTQRLSRLQGRA